MTSSTIAVTLAAPPMRAYNVRDCGACARHALATSNAARHKNIVVHVRRMAKYCVSDERVAVNRSTALGALIVVSLFAATARANSERLLATGGVTQIEGSGGGG